MTTSTQFQEKNHLLSDAEICKDNSEISTTDFAKITDKNVTRDKTASATRQLNDRHFRECVQERGLSQEWVEINCRSVDEKEASKLLGYTAKSKGVWLQGVGLQGQLRPDNPWRSAENKKAPKYRSPIGGYNIMLPIHPNDPNYWDDLEALNSKCYAINDHPCLLLTEGFFTAIAGCSNDIPTIALLGVEMGLTSSSSDPQSKRYLVEGLERFACAGFGFIIGFDADCATNPDVLMAQLKLGCQLQKFSVPVYVVTGNWTADEGKGMDDYIQRNGADAFKNEVMAKAINFETWERQFRDLSQERKFVSQASLSKEIAKKYKDKIAWHVKNKAWYWYEAPPENKKGVWSEIPDEVVGSIVFTEVELKIGLNFKHDFLAGTIKFLKYHLKEVNWEPAPGYVCLQDCVIDVATGKEYSHDPSYKFLSSLPYKWSERLIGCNPIKQWLLEICEGREDWVQVLRAAMKATVTESGRELHRYMELIGFGGTGKSTIIGLVTALVGHENVAVTELKQLERNRFETATFYGKKAVIITDSGRYAGDVDTLKALTGGDLLRYEKKGVQQTGGFKFPGIVWIACNESIQSTDYTSGLKRRRLSMSFDRVVPPHLRRDLETEFKPYLSGLLQWVLSMPDEEVIDFIRNTDKKVPSLASFSAEILLETNPIASWVDTCLVFDKEAKTYIGNMGMNTEQFLFANYCHWIETAGYKAVSQTRFSRNLLDLLKSQLGIVDATKCRDSKGAYITGVAIRHLGQDYLPRPISGDGLVTGCNDLNDGLVTSLVTGQSLASDGLQENDGLIDNGKLLPHHHLPIDDDDVGVVAELHSHHSKSSNSSLASSSAVTQPVIDDGLIQENPSLTRHQELNAAWDDTFALGNLVLSLNEKELVAVIAEYTPEQIKHIKDAANTMWQLGVNRDGDYNGERVEIWETSSLSREITCRTKSGGKIKVKRGNLRPWLGI
ncbi:DUF3854 domain-containing protein [Nostoc parmelioides]|uniref:DUF3854 domain-containing protein n=1 Tax=Nostoc parmelioides FACHB-3921 TaxID=2692909 RepID=A0ABR8BM43_9NOSO|nr:DUF3854 domain-containing protein [Nostoc parmelioides]MBD2255192.1 DUF3854 domain-containing protein [Nostoc parmelioides FACHB-3921]